MTSEEKPALQVGVLPVTPFQQNCAFITCGKTGRTAIVDPGGDVEAIRDALKEMDTTPEKILITHGHMDHAAGAAELAKALWIPVEGPNEADKFLLDDLMMAARRNGWAGQPLTPDRWLEEGDVVSVGELRFDVLHVPGHSPGSVVYVDKVNRFALTGDVLFRGSIGRTDFPYGDFDTLISGISRKLLPLGDDVVCLPGHGPATSIGQERQWNPFVRPER